MSGCRVLCSIHTLAVSQLDCRVTQRLVPRHLQVYRISSCSLEPENNSDPASPVTALAIKPSKSRLIISLVEHAARLTEIARIMINLPQLYKHPYLSLLIYYKNLPTMTTAHRPTWKPAYGLSDQVNKGYVPTRSYSARVTPFLFRIFPVISISRREGPAKGRLMS